MAPYTSQIIPRIHLILSNAYTQMCFGRNINGNRDVEFLECDLLVQQCVKLTLADFKNLKINLLYSKKTDGQEFQIVEVRKRIFTRSQL